MKSICLLYLVIFSSSLFSMENKEEPIKKIEMILRETPAEIIFHTKPNKEKNSSLWIKEFFETATEMENFFSFTIDGNWYTYFDLSRQPVLDALHYALYLEKISEKEPEKLTIDKYAFNTYLILLHGSWQPFI